MEPGELGGNRPPPGAETFLVAPTLPTWNEREGGPGSPESPEAARSVLSLRRRERPRLHLRTGPDSAGRESRRVGSARRRGPDPTMSDEHRVDPRGTRPHPDVGRQDDGLPRGPRGFPGDERGLQGVLPGGAARAVSRQAWDRESRPEGRHRGDRGVRAQDGRVADLRERE